MRQVLYAKVGNDYYPMKKLECENGDWGEAECWGAMYDDDEAGQLVWERLSPEQGGGKYAIN